MSFQDYLASKAITLCMGAIGILYLTLIFWLCGLSLSLLLILLLSGAFVLLACMLLCWQRADRRLRMLRRRLDAMPEKYLIGETLPRPRDAMELQYDLLMREISRSAIGAVEQARAETQDTCDYVESWVHEIKTPLTACSLILANGGKPSKLRRELRRADNLTETILTYAKLRTVEKDTQISLADLRTVCDQAVREEMELLIAAGISVAIEGMAGRTPIRSCWCASSSSCSSTVPNTAPMAGCAWKPPKTACSLRTTAPAFLPMSFAV